MLKKGTTPKGLRLDSGNLAELSTKARDVLKEVEKQTGVDISQRTSIIASDDLNIKKIKDMDGKHSINVFAVGTKLITCYEQAALGMVCKLCELNGTPRIKNSETVEKSTLPGPKSITRFEGTIDGTELTGDIIGCIDEKFTESTSLYRMMKYEDKIEAKITKTTDLLVDVQTHRPDFEFSALKMRQMADQRWEESKKIEADGHHQVYVSQKLRDLLFSVRHGLTKAN